MKRRGRKPADAKEKGPAPEPLQPKYFDSDLAAQPPAAEPAEPSQPARESQLDFGVKSSAYEPEPQPRPARLAQRKPVPPSPAEPNVVEKNAMEQKEEPVARPTRPRRSRRGGRGEGRRSSAAPAPPVSNALAAEPESATALESVAALEPATELEPATTEALPVPGAVIVSPPEPASADTVAAELRPAVARPAPAKPSKGTVVLAVGLPGSGKSSWFKRHNIRPLSSDLLRELLFDDAEEQRFQDLVFSNLRSMLKARLIARRPMNYIDATNLNPHERHSWIKLSKDYGYDVQGLFFDVPLEVCLERHARRGRVVPEDIMRKMAAKLKPPSFDEGFSKITVVRVKKPA